MDLGQLQSVLSSVLGLLENDRTNAASLIRNAEGHMEEIRFTRGLGERREAVMARLDRLLGVLLQDP